MGITLRQLDGGNGCSRTAAHAVVDGNHLWHVGHLDLFAGDPGSSATDAECSNHQRDVLETRDQEGAGDGNQHAVAGDDDALASTGR